MGEVHALLPAIHILVVDDNSPDGTGQLADELAAGAGEGRVHVLHREGKQGLGTAHIAGFRWRSRATTPTASRWTPTSRTSRSTCRRSWPRPRTAPTWCSAVATTKGGGTED
ncbi:MAG: glycosyltransferase [Myxococcota bacterium]